MQINYLSRLLKLTLCKISLFLMSAIILGCTQGERPAPVRPEGVPPYAKWAGGADGGNWYSCNKSKREWNYSCIIYDDFSGSIIEKGEFQLKSVYWDKQNNKPVYEDLSSLTLEFSSFDGGEVGLANSLVLVKKSVK